MLHLIKLCVGVDTLGDLADRQKQRLKELKAKGQKPELIHVTRQMPKQAEALLDGGSIYWVIKGYVTARQQLRELRPLRRQGIDYCGIIYDRKLVSVLPRPHRAFQGWRYLKPADAPRDLAAFEINNDLPEKLRRELADIGIL